MELFKETNIDFLKKQWLTLGFSGVMILASVACLILKGGPNYGIDFRGGTLVYVKFAGPPPVSMMVPSRILVWPMKSAVNRVWGW